MENKTKKSKKAGLIIIIACCVAAFVLFITMLFDFILISTSVSPLFSKIVSASESDDEYTYVTGHGLLYTTIEKRWEVGNGYFSGFKFFFGHKKWSKDIEIEINYEKFHRTQEDAEIVPPPHAPDGEDIIEDDDVLNMDAVRELAYGSIDPFEFMKKFPGTIEGDNPATYIVALPNDYVVRIEYSGDVINYMHLEDHRLNKYIELDILEIEMLLQERNESE